MGMTSTYEKKRLIDSLQSEITRATGRRYGIDLNALDIKSLRALQNLLRDLEDESRMAAQRARLFPWRTP